MHAAGDAGVARRRSVVVVLRALDALEALDPSRPARAQAVALIDPPT